MMIDTGVAFVKTLVLSQSPPLSFCLNPLGGSVSTFSFQALPRLFLGRHAGFVRTGGVRTVCRKRWEANIWVKKERAQYEWTGLGLNVSIGGSLGTISALQIVDIPAGQLKTDVS